MTFVTIAKSSFEFSIPVKIWNFEARNLPFPRLPERAHAKVGEDHRERRCQRGLSCSRRARLIAVVLSNGGSAADHCEHQEQQSGDFQPQRMQHAPDGANSNSACPVKGPYPAAFAAFPARYAEKSPALSTKTAGWHGRPRLRLSVGPGNPIPESAILTAKSGVGSGQLNTKLIETLQNFYLRFCIKSRTPKLRKS